MPNNNAQGNLNVHQWIDEQLAAVEAVRVAMDNFILPDARRHNQINPVNVKQTPYKIFWGGADLDPSFYGAERSMLCGDSNTKKDQEEINLMQKYIEQGIPIIGICRGAQILNVVNGGILVQHINDHTMTHKIDLYSKEGKHVLNATVTSTHHQMMVPTKEAIILGKSNEKVTGVHWEEVNKEHTYKYVPEVVYYPKTKSLCIQPHPEWMSQDSIFVNWINDFIKQEFNLEKINFAVEAALPW